MSHPFVSTPPSPFLRFRVFGVVGFSSASFLIIAFSSVKPLVLFGVVCASIGSGFGEITFLSLTSWYDKSTVTGWSSGTGMAGIAGATIYTVLKKFLSPRITLLVQTCIPAIMLVSYLLILGPKKAAPSLSQADSASTSEDASDTDDPGRKEGENEDPGKVGGMKDKVSPLECGGDDMDTHPLLQSEMSHKHGKFYLTRVKFFNKSETKHWVARVKYIPNLFQYMLPLFVVYFAEYAINQGFFELLYSPDTHLGSLCLDQFSQYRWLQVVYQVGVFISRTSVSFIYIRQFWIFSVLQVGHIYIYIVTCIIIEPVYSYRIKITAYSCLMPGTPPPGKRHLVTLFWAVLSTHQSMGLLPKLTQYKQKKSVKLPPDPFTCCVGTRPVSILKGRQKYDLYTHSYTPAFLLYCVVVIY